MLNQNIKNNLKSLVYKITDYIPSILISNLIFYFPKTIRIVGRNKEIITHHYLGNLRVRTNIKYRIERYMLFGLYEPDSIAIFNKFIKKDDTCIDIGANVGALTLAMADLVGKQGEVYSFEPGPRNYARLSFNINLNEGFDKIIQPIEMGVSNKEGKLYWEEEMHNLGNAELKNKGSIEVPVTTIDKFFNNKSLGKVGFVKVDIEGMELEAFKGGIETWKAHEPIFYFETLEPFRYRDGIDIFNEIELFFKSIDYSLYNINKIDAITKTTSNDLSNNTIALKNGFKIEEF
jgi:FkbM family methyltransferase